MATTLVNLRAKLNGEIGVLSDADTVPWTTTVRNNAISDGYAELWRVGVWKPLVETAATDSTAWTYALTGIRRLERIELLDSSSYVVERPKGLVEDNGSGGYQLRLQNPISTGYPLRIRGWGAYKSTFTGDSDPDDLPAEHNRVPLLKAKAILYRAQLASFARYGQRQVTVPELNVSVDQLLGIIATAEKEFAEEARILAGQRARTGQMRSL